MTTPRLDIPGLDQAPRPRREADLLLSLLDSLAAAMRHGLPVVPMLEGLLRDRSAAAPALVRSARWRRRMVRIVTDLEAGQPLGRTLATRLARQLPRHYRVALAEADRDGNLERVLPVVTDSLRRSLVATEQWYMAFLYPLTVLGTAWLLTSGFFVFVVPKLVQICEDLLPPGEPFPLPVRFLLAAGRVIHGLWQVLPLAAVGLVVLAWLVRRQRRDPGRPYALAERLCLRLPVVGGQTRRLALLDFAQGLGLQLNTGHDLAAAVAASLETTRSPWLRARARTLLERVTAGERWADAWANLGLGSALHQWIVRSAAEREAPAAGFDLLAQCLAEEIGRTSRLAQQWAEVAGILFNATVVAPIVVAVFSILVHLVFLSMALE